MQTERGRREMHLSNQDLSKLNDSEGLNDYVPEGVPYIAGIRARNS